MAFSELIIHIPLLKLILGRVSLLSKLLDGPVKLTLTALCLGIHSLKNLTNAYHIPDTALVLKVNKMSKIQSLLAFECNVAIELIWKSGEIFMYFFKNI